jgi:hypothetical protein
LNEIAAIWSEETRSTLLAKVGTVAMISSTPPTWCTAYTSPNEWTIIQNAIRPGIIVSNDVAVTKPSLTRGQVEKYPLTIVAIGCEISVTEKDDSSSTKKYMVLTLVLIATMCLVYFTSLSPINTPRTVNNRFDGNMSTSIHDSIVSGNEAQLLKRHVSSNVQDVDDTIGLKLIISEQLNSTESGRLAQEAAIASSVDVLANEMVAHTELGLPLAPHQDSVVKIGVTNVPTSDSESVNSSGTMMVNVANGRYTSTLSDVELAFEQHVLQFVHRRTLKIEEKLQQVKLHLPILSIMDNISTKFPVLVVKIKDSVRTTSSALNHRCTYINCF